MKTTSRIKTTMRLSVFAACLATVVPVAQAGPFLGAIPPFPILPTVGVPVGPEHHPGKEYSDELDRNAAGLFESTRNIMFDGRTPSGIADTFRYIPGLPPSPNPSSNEPQVDALAHPTDFLFGEVISNRTALLFSTRIQPTPPGPPLGPNVQGAGFDGGAPAKGCAAGDPICYETVPGGIGTWATKLQVNQHAPDFPQNLDGLEVFGPDGVDDALRFSLFGDASTGCSVFIFDGSAVTGCAVTHAEIAALFPRIDPNEIDIDALMMNGETILFSLWPNSVLPVGDSAWVWTRGGSFAPLDHGGHLWTEGWLGLNVDALEAGAGLPEPGTLAIFALGLGAMGWARRRQR